MGQKINRIFLQHADDTTSTEKKYVVEPLSSFNTLLDWKLRMLLTPCIYFSVSLKKILHDEMFCFMLENPGPSTML